MMRDSLSQRLARPRRSWSSPNYPRAAAFGAILTACCGGTNPAPQQPAEASTVATVPAEPSTPLVMAGEDNSPASSAPLATAGMHFPEDDEPLENVGCRGKCAAPYVLGLSAKDRGQIEARIKYCDNAAKQQGDRSTGSVSVTAEIAADGRARDVKLTPDGDVSQTVLDCVRTLVKTAPFSSEHDTERTTRFKGALDK